MPWSCRARAVNADTVAKLLFTSGTTGSAEIVISTNRMMCSLMQMVRGCHPMLAEEAPVLVDWLPCNHLFGGTVSFCIALYNGGTLYIDDGKPLSGQIEKTVRNLREVAPLFYSNVPKGYEELIPWLRRDRALRANFFSRVRVLQYFCASITQNVCDAFDELACKTIGLPPPGVTLKLTSTHGKLELRVQGPCVTPTGSETISLPTPSTKTVFCEPAMPCSGRTPEIGNAASATTDASPRTSSWRPARGSASVRSERISCSI